jgi:hypothetical protein
MTIVGCESSKVSLGLFCQAVIIEEAYTEHLLYAEYCPGCAQRSPCPQGQKTHTRHIQHFLMHELCAPEDGAESHLDGPRMLSEQGSAMHRKLMIKAAKVGGSWLLA